MSAALGSRWCFWNVQGELVGRLLSPGSGIQPLSRDRSEDLGVPCIEGGGLGSPGENVLTGRGGYLDEAASRPRPPGGVPLRAKDREGFKDPARNLLWATSSG